MRITALTVIACIAFSIPVIAQTSPSDVPATREDVEAYLNAIHSHDMTKQMLQAMSAPMHKLIHEEFQKDKDKLPADFETRMQNVMDDYISTMPLDEMTQAMVPAYQKHFTKGDLNALVSFYSSPVGQKILRELPAVTAEGLNAMVPLMRKQMDALNERMQHEIAEMKQNIQKQPARNAPVRN